MGLQISYWIIYVYCHQEETTVDDYFSFFLMLLLFTQTLSLLVLFGTHHHWEKTLLRKELTERQVWDVCHLVCLSPTRHLETLRKRSPFYSVYTKTRPKTKCICRWKAWLDRSRQWSEAKGSSVTVFQRHFYNELLETTVSACKVVKIPVSPNTKIIA